jgi:hypothetical protein
MPSQFPPPSGSRPRVVSPPVPRPALRPARGAALGPPAVNTEENAVPTDRALVYWPVIGALAGFCVVLLLLLVLVLRSERHQPAAASTAQKAEARSGGARVADTVPTPAPRRAPASAPDTLPPPPKVNSPAAPALADSDPPDDGSPAPPPPPTGLPDLLRPQSGGCPAPQPGGVAARERYGTAVDFVDDPTGAARQALREKKLLFVLHVAGNFEDSHFT